MKQSSLLLSGGNDGRVILQSWSAPPDVSMLDSLGAPQTELELLAGLQHGRKINAVRALGGELSCVCVADVSKTISIYSMH